MNNGVLMYYGTKHHSGRYPYGSGENPYQHEEGFLGFVKSLKDNGLSEKDIAVACGMSINELRANISIAKDELRINNTSEAVRLAAEGYSNVEIGKRLNVSEGTVRNYLKDSTAERAKLTNEVADALKSSVAEKKYIDVGAGTEQHLHVSRTKMKTAIEKLKEEGYTVHYLSVPQLGTASGNKTTVMVLAAPGTTYKEVFDNRDQVRLPTNHYISEDGRSLLGLQKPVSVDSSRIKVNYKEDGGSEKDGVIELRRGVGDISLGNASYAQVRIAVDDTHYLKGMAMYKDDMPKGVDIIFNTNKSKEGNPNKTDVMKPLKSDKDNPFGAEIKREEELIYCQRYYTDSDGKKKLSAINVVNEEGDWNSWSKTLSSQMLSKQTTTLAKQQLNLAYGDKKAEFDEYMSLTNPVVKKKLLDSFADDCDAAAVHLKAAALPRQRSQVILPVTSMKDTEIYAPNFKNGERVVLIRYPHGGTFEIPELTVNNRQREAKSILGDAQDAVGISAKVAERLSGADFDGDTVLVIPNNRKSIVSTPALKGLADFDPKEVYAVKPIYDKNGKITNPTISNKTKQIEMGKVSNLITDMTIQGADPEEICKAVKHSMVVIDAEKHNLDYKRSFSENSIAELKERYQGGKDKGAYTLISKASSDLYVPARKKYVKIDPKTGEKIYTETGETYKEVKVKKDKDGNKIIDPKTGKPVYYETGKILQRKTKSTKMAEVKDAYELSSGLMMENIYAEHANKLKALANEARKESYNTKAITYSPNASKVYAKEVSRLKSALNLAKQNAPLERQAQILANSIVDAKKRANPDIDSDGLKKIKDQALKEARYRTGAHKNQIVISDREWEAIQAGAISNNMLTQIINNSDLDKVKELATPRQKTSMSSSKLARAKAMVNNGWTYAEVAEALGVSVSTLSKAVNG